MPPHRTLEVVPLGGLGEFGLNLMVYRLGDDALVVDVGMMFPGAEHLGIDAVVPELTYLDDCPTIHGVLLTHGHEDHVGALSHLLARRDVPVYGSPYTLGWAERRLLRHTPERRASLLPLPPPGETLKLGPFTVEPIAAGHSIPQARIFAIHTPLGSIVHCSDFKFDPTLPDGERTDLARLRQLGDDGVLLLAADSTNADVPGVTAGERTIHEPLLRAVRAARGRVIVTTFASHVRRLELLTDVARRCGRRVSLLGSSVRAHVALAERLGVLPLDPYRLHAERMMDHPGERVLAVVAGSQGEPNSSMTRVSTDEHPDLSIEPGDVVIHAARRIPGSELAIRAMVNRVLRRGARLIDGERAGVHVSGHAAADELRQLVELVRPRFMVPIHGEYAQLAAHARLAADSGLGSERVLLIESGERLLVGPSGAERAGRVPAGHVLIDGALEADDETVRDRRLLAGDGIVVPVLRLRPGADPSGIVPEVVARGFVAGLDGEHETVMQEARKVIVESLDEAAPAERGDEALLKARIGRDLRRFFKRRLGRRPLVLPVIVEW